MYPQALKAIQVATVKAIQQRIEVRGHTEMALMHSSAQGPAVRARMGLCTVMV